MSATRSLLSMIRVSLLSSLVCPFFLQGEIEQIALSWREINCDPSCEEKIVERLQDFDQIESVNLIPGAGQAVVKWKSGTPFSYSPLNRALRRVSPSLQMVQMVVTGKVEEMGEQILLFSEGDGTKFLLVNPTKAQSRGVAVQGTMRGRELSVDQRQELLSAKKEGLSVTISGNLFEPFRSPPYRLIVANISLGTKEPKNEKLDEAEIRDSTFNLRDGKLDSSEIRDSTFNLRDGKLDSSEIRDSTFNLRDGKLDSSEIRDSTFNLRDGKLDSSEIRNPTHLKTED